MKLSVSCMTPKIKDGHCMEIVINAKIQELLTEWLEREVTWKVSFLHAP
jgi:hypothetical protein